MPNTPLLPQGIRPRPNPAVPVLNLPEGRVQVGWDRTRRYAAPQAARIDAALARLRRTESVDSYTADELAGLHLLIEGGAVIGASRSPGAMAGDRSGPALPAAAESLTRLDGHDIVAARSRSSVALVGPPQWAGVLELLRSAGAAPALDHRRADLVILTGRPGFEVVSALMRRGTPHLAVSPRASSVRVGPLVVPSQTACLQCLHLTRRDRDPLWPQVAHRLQLRPQADMDPLLLHQAAALVAKVVLWHLDGRTDLGGRWWTVDQAEPGIPEQGLARHPLCGCWWEPLLAAEESLG